VTVEPRHCIKCGREIGPDETICEFCNRAGMATPSATQYHGTIAVAIVAAVAVLAFAAGLSLRGIGPWSADVLEVRASSAQGVTVTVGVTNEGTRAGSAKCQIEAFDAAGSRIRAVSFTSQRIPGGAQATAEERLPGVQEEPASVTVDCS
jgi:predicted nucleic acid-binding Zn ribbon protein